MDNDQVNMKSAAVSAMEEAWSLVDDLRGGTSAMRKAGARRMPKFPQESDSVYTARLNAATLFPAYSKTCVDLAAKPFSRPITMSEDMTDEQEKWTENIDKQGRNLAQYCAEWLELSIAYGMSHTFVDFPVNPGARTKKQEEDLGLRPYFVMVKATQLLGWRADEDGRLTQVRFKEKVRVEDGAYGDKEIEQVRVLEVGRWATWRKTTDAAAGGKESWAIHAQGQTTLNVIPFVTVYGRREGLLMSKPPMIELAHMNVKHWQSQSDQDNILHVARVPILKAIGVDDMFTLTVGTQAAVKLPPGADLAFAEHSGAAIGAGKVSLDDLKDEMRQAGAELLVQRPTARTATEISSDNASNLSDLQRIVQDMEDNVDLALDYMAQWARLPKAGTVTIYNEFLAPTGGENATSDVLAAVTAGILSKESAFGELKRRGTINSEASWDEEKERIEDEGPPQGRIDELTGLPYKEPAAPPDPNAVPAGPKPPIQ